MAMPYSPPPRTRIMVAVAPVFRDRLLRILKGHEIVAVETRKQAMRELDQGSAFGMIILGVDFDESQMFTLLGDIRHHTKYRNTPVLVILSQQKYPVTDVLLEGLDHAIKAVGGNGFLKFDQFPDDEAGNARIRRVVDYLILIDGDLHHVAQQAGDPVITSMVGARESKS